MRGDEPTAAPDCAMRVEHPEPGIAVVDGMLNDDDLDQCAPSATPFVVEQLGSGPGRDRLPERREHGVSEDDVERTGVDPFGGQVPQNSDTSVVVRVPVERALAKKKVKSDAASRPVRSGCVTGRHPGFLGRWLVVAPTGWGGAIVAVSPDTIAATPSRQVRAIPVAR